MIDYIGRINQLKHIVFCFTGKAPEPRVKMEAMAIASGASVTKSVTLSTTTLVIADPDSKSSKASKARSMGLNLITPEEFFELCFNPIPTDDPITMDKVISSYKKSKPKTKMPDKKSEYSNKRRIQL